MAPGILAEETASNQASQVHDHASEPLRPSGALEKFEYEDVTPIIGREFPNLNIVNDLINGENSDELLRELAITSKNTSSYRLQSDTYMSAVSRRGVVFFRAQDNPTNDLQKQLVDRLGQLTQKPSTSKLHIHPVLNNTSEFGVDDAELSTVNSQGPKTICPGI